MPNVLMSTAIDCVYINLLFVQFIYREEGERERESVRKRERERERER